MSKEFNPLDTDIDDLRDNFSKKSIATLKKYTASQLASIIVANGLSKKSLTTLEPMAKKDLKDIILNGDKEPQQAKSKVSPTSTSSQGATNGILDIANSLKKHLHGTPLTSFTQEQGSKAVEGAIDKANEYDENIVNKMGWMGIAFGGAVIAIDTVIGFENVGEMAKQFLKPQNTPGQKVNND